MKDYKIEKNQIDDNMMNQMFDHHVIVLTGGPCSGKTTLLENLKEKFSDNEEICFVPEVASQLLEEGLPLFGEEGWSQEWQNWFQYKILERQAEIDANLFGTWRNKGTHKNVKVVVYDRHYIDGAAYYRSHKTNCGSYVDDHNFGHFPYLSESESDFLGFVDEMDSLGRGYFTATDYCNNLKGGKVFHLRSLAVSNPMKYEYLKSSNPHRMEDAEDAAKADTKITTAYLKVGIKADFLDMFSDDSSVVVEEYINSLL